MNSLTLDSLPRPSSSSSSPSPVASRARLWGGRVTTGLAALFLGFDVVIKLVQHPAAIAGSAELGFQPGHVFVIGVIAAICLALYLVPRTAILGAVLWTGYFGGAIAIQLRAGNPLFSHTLFPIYVAALVWAGIWLREPRLRALLPLRA